MSLVLVRVGTPSKPRFASPCRVRQLGSPGRACRSSGVQPAEIPRSRRRRSGRARQRSSGFADPGIVTARPHAARVRYPADAADRPGELALRRRARSVRRTHGNRAVDRHNCRLVTDDEVNDALALQAVRERQDPGVSMTPTSKPFCARHPSTPIDLAMGEGMRSILAACQSNGSGAQPRRGVANLQGHPVQT